MFRNRLTGEVLTDRQVRLAHRNISLPKVLKEDILDGLGYDPVLSGSRPETTSPYEVVVKGEVQKIDGYWRETYIVVTKDADRIDRAKSQEVRSVRDSLLSETDWAVSADATIPDGMLEYRQALRDITNQEGFPHNVVMPELSDFTLDNLTEQQQAVRRMQRANYLGFWQSLIRSTTYTTLKANAKVDLGANVLATELISLLGDAKSGKPDIEALQVGIWETFSILTPELAGELRALMDANGMDDYTSTPPTE